MKKTDETYEPMPKQFSVVFITITWITSKVKQLAAFSRLINERQSIEKPGH